MKIETLRPGAMAINTSRWWTAGELLFAAAVDRRRAAGAAYRVKLDVNGPRFTISIAGEPWTSGPITASRTARSDS